MLDELELLEELTAARGKAEREHRDARERANLVLDH